MDGSPPVVAVGQSKSSNKLTRTEWWLAALLICFGVLLICGTLGWYALSTDGAAMVSKEIHTTEPVGKAAGEKKTEETDYAESLITFGLTIGAVMVIAGAFFGRIREIKFGTASVVLTAPEEEKEKAERKAEDDAKVAAPPGKEDEAAALARTLASQQIDLAYAVAPPSAKSSVADGVGSAAAATAVSALAKNP
jgi:hypothetical protein